MNKKYKHICQWLVFAIILLGLSSCNNAQSYKERNADTLISIIEETPEYHLDEDKVIADLHFFISEKDFEKNKSKYLKQITDNIGWYKIGEYGSSNISSMFENDSLYHIEFNGHFREIEDYERKLIPEYKDLLKTYESKYGEPRFQSDSFPKSYEMDEGYYYELSRWDLGKRTISIRVSQKSYMYQINLVIYRNDIDNRIKERHKNQSEENRVSASSVI